MMQLGGEQCIWLCGLLNDVKIVAVTARAPYSRRWRGAREGGDAAERSDAGLVSTLDFKVQRVAAALYVAW